MAIEHWCPVCRSQLASPPEAAGRKLVCPACHTLLIVPLQSETSDAGVAAKQTSHSAEICFLDGLSTLASRDPVSDAPVVAATIHSDWKQRMFAALLDPRSIQWLLTLGGGLMVLGGLIWLVSKGVLENPLVLAAVFGAASLGLLMGGWFITLKTRYKIAGRALAFLGCVVVPLNLWFYHAQGLLMLDHGLWVGGVACVLLYAATIWVLRDPLFVYALEAGITLTAVLLLGNFGLAGQATHLCLLLMTLALVSLHAQWALPLKGEWLTREKFGLPCFWSGQLQLAASLGILAATQTANLLVQQLGNVFEIPASGILLTNAPWIAGLLWLAGAYAYLYSDLAVRRNGIYTYLAAICLVLAEATLLRLVPWGVEGFIAALAITAAIGNLLLKAATARDPRYARAFPPLALVLSFLPLMMGVALHLRTMSSIGSELPWQIAPANPWMLVAAMLIVAVANRVSAYVYEATRLRVATAYFFFSAMALLVAFSAALQIVGRETWLDQAPLLMLLPIGYVVAARLWRGRAPELPLDWIAQAATVVILACSLSGAIELFRDNRTSQAHALLALILVEAAIVYILAALFRGHPRNVYFAVAAACLAVWQLLLAVHLPTELFTCIFAAMGLALLVCAKLLKLDDVTIRTGERRDSRGWAMLRAGHGVLSLALATAIAKGIFQLVAVMLDRSVLTHLDWIALCVMIVASVAAVFLARSDERRGYLSAMIALAGLTFLTLNVALDISPWRKLEIVLVGVGVVMLGAAYIGRFRETPSREASEAVAWMLWLGSLLATAPLIVAVFHHWRTASEFSFYDEIALLTVATLMLASGVVWRVKASTLCGGATLTTYLAVLVVSLLYRPQVAIGIYLAAGGAVIFAAGLVLAIYRDRLLALPDRIAKREGVFGVIGWR